MEGLRLDRRKLGKGGSPERAEDTGPQVWKWGSSLNQSSVHGLTLAKPLLSCLRFPGAELDNWPEAGEEEERKRMLSD